MRNAQFVGRVTRQPKVVAKKNCAPVSIAVNESYKRKDSDEYENKSYFITAWAYGKTAEYAERNLNPGDVVAVETRVGTSVNGDGHTDGYSFNVTNLNTISRNKGERQGTSDEPPF